MKLKEREIPLFDDFDVIVVGGGPAGCTAAASAAREGAKTLLIEATGCLGGMGTNGLVPCWCPFSDKKKIIYRGMAEKVFTEAKKGMAHVKESALDWVPIDAERLKRVYDELVTGAGAKILFNTMLSAVNTEDGKVTEIIVTNKRGLSAYRAKVFIDCTGDADLAAWAGAEYKVGGDNGEGVMSSTNCFLICNVDDYAFEHGERLFCANPKSPIYKILTSGKYPDIPDFHICNVKVGPGVIGFNAGHIFDLDSTDPVAMSAAMIKGRKIAAAFRDALAEFAPEAFGNSYLVSTGPLMGIRESRRIIGDYVLSKDDFLARRSFPDEIGRNCYYIDVHNKDAKSAKTHEDWLKMESDPTKHYKPGESHGIPYRCLVPKDLKNVLVAGRSISCDQVIQGSVRVMPNCLVMGEAAGIAAKFASDADSDVHKVNTDALRQKLREYGAYLP